MARIRVNVLCLVGALFAALAIFEIWLSGRSGTMGWFANLYTILENFSRSSDFWLAAALFIVGAILAIATPLGGVLQITGISLFFYAFGSLYDGRLPPDVGPYWGLAAAVLTTASLALPIGIEFTTKPNGVEFTCKPKDMLSRVITVRLSS